MLAIVYKRDEARATPSKLQFSLHLHLSRRGLGGDDVRQTLDRRSLSKHHMAVSDTSNLIMMLHEVYRSYKQHTTIS